MKIPAWLVITSHFVRGFAVAFLTAIVAGPLDAKLTWIASIGGGLVGGVNAMDALRSDASETTIGKPREGGQ